MPEKYGNTGWVLLQGGCEPGESLLVDKSNLMTDFSPYVLFRGADKSSYFYSYLGLATNIIGIAQGKGSPFLEI